MPQPLKQQIGNISIVVDDYDDALEFYIEKLQFVLINDIALG
jgi:lactoylglutathione lyase